MIARSLVVAVVVVSSAGCIVPRSAGYGFTANPVGAGGADVGLAVGAMFQQESSSQATGGAGNLTAQQVQLPGFEANAQLGVSDQLAVNLHASQAGVQPGVKITVLRDPVTVSVVPQLGGGFLTNGTYSSGSAGGGGVLNSGVTSFTFTGGVHALVSHPIGLYGGLGYDFQYISRSSLTNATGNPTTSTTFQQAHNVGGAVGYELRLGSIALRPELAVLFTPLAKNQSNNGTATTDAPDSRGLFLFPNITVAAVAPPRGK